MGIFSAGGITRASDRLVDAKWPTRSTKPRLPSAHCQKHNGVGRYRFALGFGEVIGDLGRAGKLPDGNGSPPKPSPSASLTSTLICN